MSIDTSIYMADVPAGTYAAGDIINLVPSDGPANVRSGRGRAILKTVVCGSLAAGLPLWKIHVKNSDWIDDVQSVAGQAYTTTAFDEESGSVQSGHDCNLTENSGWQIYAECIVGGTSTVANSLFALIDIDYPQVGGVTNPKNAVGFPTSIPIDYPSVTVHATGAAVGSTWDVLNVDYLKAGFKYVLDAVEIISNTQNLVGFVAFSNAAGMGGLTRIIPVNAYQVTAIRHCIKYSSVLQKGPMDVKLKLFAPTAGTTAIAAIHDYVKQRA